MFTIHNPFINTIIVFSLIVILIYIIKPLFLYDHAEYKFKTMQISENHTLSLIYPFSIFLVIMIYIIFYCLSTVNTKNKNIKNIQINEYEQLYKLQLQQIQQLQQQLMNQQLMNQNMIEKIQNTK